MNIGRYQIVVWRAWRAWLWGRYPMPPAFQAVYGRAAFVIGPFEFRRFTDAAMKSRAISNPSR